MTAQELIEILKQYPPETRLLSCANGEYPSGWVWKEIECHLPDPDYPNSVLIW